MEILARQVASKSSITVMKPANNSVKFNYSCPIHTFVVFFITCKVHSDLLALLVKRFAVDILLIHPEKNTDKLKDGYNHHISKLLEIKKRLPQY